MILSLIAGLVLASPGSAISAPPESAPWQEHRRAVRRAGDIGKLEQLVISYQSRLKGATSLMPNSRYGYILAADEYSKVLGPKSTHWPGPVFVDPEESVRLLSKNWRHHDAALIAMTSRARFPARTQKEPVAKLLKEGVELGSPKWKNNFEDLHHSRAAELRAEALSIVQKKFKNDPGVSVNLWPVEQPQALKNRIAQLQAAWENEGKMVMPEMILIRMSEAYRQAGDMEKSKQTMARLKKVILSKPKSQTANRWKRMLIASGRW